jgi:hypothetical protein
MKKYYAVSFVLLWMLFIGLSIAKIVFGGETVVTLPWTIFFLTITLNTIIASILYVGDTLNVI